MFNLNALVSYEHAKGRKVQPATVGGVPGRWVDMGQPTRGAMLFVHGGGFVIGSSKAYRSLAARLSEATGQRVFVPDYRLAPEHPYPAALDDVTDVYYALVAEFGPELTVCGDSAGGGLVMSLMHRLSRSAGTWPRRVAVMSPITDARLETPSIEANKRSDPLLPVKWVRDGVACYLGDADAAEPELSPALGQFAGCPPVLIQVGADEVLLDDARRMATTLEEQGVSVTLRVWPHVPHVWHFHSRRVPEADAGIAEIGAFLRSDATAQAETSTTPRMG